MSEFGVSDSPCNTSTKNECGVNLHYVKVGLVGKVRRGLSSTEGIFFASSAARSDEYGRNSRIRGSNPRDLCADFGEARAGSGRFRAASAEKPFDATCCCRSGHRSVGNHRPMTPRRSPGPWFLAGAPSKLSIRPASTSMRPPRCDDFQRFERAKSSAGLGAHPPYCTDRFCGGRVPDRVGERIDRGGG